MTAPIAPSLNSICLEALKKAGYKDPQSTDSDIYARSQTEWMSEIKNDIWSLSKKLISMQTSTVTITANGRIKYNFPADFSSILKMTLLDGDVSSTFQSGSTTTSWVLNASEASISLIGKEILVTAGTAQGQIGQVIAYDSGTKTATVDNCTIAPVSGDTYLIITSETEIKEKPVWDLASSGETTGSPDEYYPEGNSTTGAFYVRPVPDGVYGIRIRYYADLTLLDLDGTLMATLYRRWEQVFKLGIELKARLNMDDTTATGIATLYGSALQQLNMRETYGYDMSDLRMRVAE